MHRSAPFRRPALQALLLATCLAAMPQIAAAAPLPDAVLDRMTDDLLALSGGDADSGRTAARDALAALDRALADKDANLQPLPAALAQGAALARRAEHPASRAVFADLTRDMLATAVRESGPAAPAAPLLAAWDRRDPGVADLVPGQSLTQGDLDAGQRLAALMPEQKGISVRTFWDSQADEPVNRVLPTRMDAWTAGTVAAWDKLDPAQRWLAVGVLDNAEVPPAELLQAVIGTSDVLGWLGAVDVPMTDQERAASPELLAYMQAGAFAGPVGPPLEARAAAIAAQGIAGDVAGDMANQMMRLNNWSAMTGETHSWDAYRYSTQGY